MRVETGGGMLAAGESVEMVDGRLAQVTRVISPVKFECQEFLSLEDIFLCVGGGLPTLAALDHRQRFLRNDDKQEEKVKNVLRVVPVAYVEPGHSPPNECEFYFTMKFSSRGNSFEDYKSRRCQTSSSKLLAADLYSGCGGLSFACIEGHITPKVAVEQDGDACRSYQANHPQAKVHKMTVEDFNRVLKRLNELEEQRNEHILQGHTRSAVTQVRVSQGCIEFRLNGAWLPEKAIGKEELGRFLQERESHGFPRKGTIGIVMGGTPCQGVSSMNIRAPNRDILSTENNFQVNHFFESVKMLDPDFVLLENVRNILTRDDGVYGKCAALELLNQGYQLRMGVLAAGNYGAPQVRLRCFIWGAKSGKNLPGFPSPLFAMPNNKWIYKQTNCDVRPREEETTTLFPYVTLGDITSDLPRSSNFSTTGLYRYKRDPVTPMQHWLRRRRGGNLGNLDRPVLEGVSRKRTIEMATREMGNESDAEIRQRKVRVIVGREVMKEEKVSEKKTVRIEGLAKTVEAQCEEFHEWIGAQVMEAESEQLHEAVDGEDLLFDHLPRKMSSVDLERVVNIPQGDGKGLEHMPGVVQRRGGFCCGHWHCRDCPAGGSEEPLLVKNVPRGVYQCKNGCESRGYILASRRFLVEKYFLDHKKSSYRRIDRKDTVGTLVGRSDPHMIATKGMLHYKEDRCLTVAECKRVQGFPDRYLLCGDPNSKFRQIGNAVSPHCAESLGYCLLQALQSGARQDFIVDISNESKMCQEIREALKRGLSFFNRKIETLCLVSDEDE